MLNGAARVLYIYCCRLLLHTGRALRPGGTLPCLNLPRAKRCRQAQACLHTEGLPYMIPRAVGRSFPLNSPLVKMHSTQINHTPYLRFFFSGCYKILIYIKRWTNRFFSQVLRPPHPCCASRKQNTPFCKGCVEGSWKLLLSSPATTPSYARCPAHTLRCPLRPPAFAYCCCDGCTYIARSCCRSRKSRSSSSQRGARCCPCG